nr:hypothetical protein [Flavobacterium omnivorum]
MFFPIHLFEDASTGAWDKGGIIKNYDYVGCEHYHERKRGHETKKACLWDNKQ